MFPSTTTSSLFAPQLPECRVDISHITKSLAQQGSQIDLKNDFSKGLLSNFNMSAAQHQNQKPTSIMRAKSAGPVGQGFKFSKPVFLGVGSSPKLQKVNLLQPPSLSSIVNQRTSNVLNASFSNWIWNSVSNSPSPKKPGQWLTNLNQVNAGGRLSFSPAQRITSTSAQQKINLNPNITSATQNKIQQLLQGFGAGKQQRPSSLGGHQQKMRSRSHSVSNASSRRSSPRHSNNSSRSHSRHSSPGALSRTPRGKSQTQQQQNLNNNILLQQTQNQTIINNSFEKSLRSQSLLMERFKQSQFQQNSQQKKVGVGLNLSLNTPSNFGLSPFKKFNFNAVSASGKKQKSKKWNVPPSKLHQQQRWQSANSSRTNSKTQTNINNINANVNSSVDIQYISSVESTQAGGWGQQQQAREIDMATLVKFYANMSAYAKTNVMVGARTRSDFDGAGIAMGQMPSQFQTGEVDISLLVAEYLRATTGKTPKIVRKDPFLGRERRITDDLCYASDLDRPAADPEVYFKRQKAKIIKKQREARNGRKFLTQYLAESLPDRYPDGIERRKKTFTKDPFLGRSVRVTDGKPYIWLLREVREHNEDKGLSEDQNVQPAFVQHARASGIQHLGAGSKRYEREPSISEYHSRVRQDQQYQQQNQVLGGYLQNQFGFGAGQEANNTTLSTIQADDQLKPHAHTTSNYWLHPDAYKETSKDGTIWWRARGKPVWINPKKDKKQYPQCYSNERMLQFLEEQERQEQINLTSDYSCNNSRSGSKTTSRSGKSSWCDSNFGGGYNKSKTQTKIIKLNNRNYSYSPNTRPRQVNVTDPQVLQVDPLNTIDKNTLQKLAPEYQLGSQLHAQRNLSVASKMQVPLSSGGRVVVPLRGDVGQLQDLLNQALGEVGISQLHGQQANSDQQQQQFNDMIGEDPNSVEVKNAFHKLDQHSQARLSLQTGMLDESQIDPHMLSQYAASYKSSASGWNTNKRSKSAVNASVHKASSINYVKKNRWTAGDANIHRQRYINQRPTGSKSSFNSSWSDDFNANAIQKQNSKNSKKRESTTGKLFEHNTHKHFSNSINNYEPILWKQSQYSQQDFVQKNHKDAFERTSHSPVNLFNSRSASRAWSPTNPWGSLHWWNQYSGSQIMQQRLLQRGVNVTGVNQKEVSQSETETMDQQKQNQQKLSGGRPSTLPASQVKLHHEPYPWDSWQNSPNQNQHQGWGLEFANQEQRNIHNGDTVWSIIMNKNSEASQRRLTSSTQQLQQYYDDTKDHKRKLSQSSSRTASPPSQNQPLSKSSQQQWNNSPKYQRHSNFQQQHDQQNQKSLSTSENEAALGKHASEQNKNLSQKVEELVTEHKRHSLKTRNLPSPTAASTTKQDAADKNSNSPSTRLNSYLNQRNSLLKEKHDELKLQQKNAQEKRQSFFKNKSDNAVAKAKQTTGASPKNTTFSSKKGGDYTNANNKTGWSQSSKQQQQRTPSSSPKVNKVATEGSHRSIPQHFVSEGRHKSAAPVLIQSTASLESQVQQQEQQQVQRKSTTINMAPAEFIVDRGEETDQSQPSSSESLSDQNQGKTESKQTTDSESQSQTVKQNQNYDQDQEDPLESRPSQEILDSIESRRLRARAEAIRQRRQTKLQELKDQLDATSPRRLSQSNLSRRNTTWNVKEKVTSIEQQQHRTPSPGSKLRVRSNSAGATGFYGENLDLQKMNPSHMLQSSGKKKRFSKFQKEKLGIKAKSRSTSPAKAADLVNDQRLAFVAVQSQGPMAQERMSPPKQTKTKRTLNRSWMRSRSNTVSPQKQQLSQQRNTTSQANQHLARKTAPDTFNYNQSIRQRITLQDDIKQAEEQQHQQQAPNFNNHTDQNSHLHIHRFPPPGSTKSRMSDLESQITVELEPRPASHQWSISWQDPDDIESDSDDEGNGQGQGQGFNLNQYGLMSKEQERSSIREIRESQWYQQQSTSQQQSNSNQVKPGYGQSSRERPLSRQEQHEQDRQIADTYQKYQKSDAYRALSPELKQAFQNVVFNIPNNMGGQQQHQQSGQQSESFSLSPKNSRSPTQHQKNRFKTQPFKQMQQQPQNFTDQNQTQHEPLQQQQAQLFTRRTRDGNVNLLQGGLSFSSNNINTNTPNGKQASNHNKPGNILQSVLNNAEESVSLNVGLRNLGGNTNSNNSFILKNKQNVLQNSAKKKQKVTHQNQSKAKRNDPFKKAKREASWDTSPSAAWKGGLRM